MPSDLTPLSVLAGRTVVAAASTDEWGTAKHEIARLIGCGSQERERLAERQLDQTREPLQAAPGQELEEARAGLEAVWGVRLRHLLEEHPEKAGELQVLVDQIQAKLPAQDWSKRTQWRDALQPIPRILGWYKDNAVAGILLAAGFVVLKGYVVARGDVATALGILQYAGLATVVTAGLLSSLPIVAAAMLAYTLSRVLARVLTRSKEQPPTFSRPLLWVTLGAFALAALFAPWTYLVLAGAIGLAMALRASGRVAWLGAGLVRVLLAFVTLAAVIFSLYAVWVPHEVVNFRPGTEPITRQVGYVLSGDNGWITMLTSQAHQIVHYPDAEVRSQVVCERSSILTSQPSLWDLLTEVNSTVKSVLHPAPAGRCPG